MRKQFFPGAAREGVALLLSSRRGAGLHAHSYLYYMVDCL
jgi:hypothetical protein